MPKYDCLRYDLIHNIVDGANFNYSGSNVRVFRGQVEGLNTTFLEPDNGMFGVGCVYGRDDDAHRFNYFCGAALEYLKHHAPHKTDVVHCHDWPTAPVAFGDVGDSKYGPTFLASLTKLKAESKTEACKQTQRHNLSNSQSLEWHNGSITEIFPRTLFHSVVPPSTSRCCYCSSTKTVYHAKYCTSV